MKIHAEDLERRAEARGHELGRVEQLVAAAHRAVALEQRVAPRHAQDLRAGERAQAVRERSEEEEAVVEATDGTDEAHPQPRQHQAHGERVHFPHGPRDRERERDEARRAARRPAGDEAVRDDDEVHGRRRRASPGNELRLRTRDQRGAQRERRERGDRRDEAREVTVGHERAEAM